MIEKWNNIIAKIHEYNQYNQEIQNIKQNNLDLKKTFITEIRDNLLPILQYDKRKDINDFIKQIYEKCQSILENNDSYYDSLFQLLNLLQEKGFIEKGFIIKDKEHKKLYQQKMNDIRKIFSDINLNNQQIKTLKDKQKVMEENIVGNNLSFTNVYNLIKFKDGMPILSDEILKGIKLDQDFYDFSLDDLVMVHATKYFPQNGVIRTTKNFNVKLDSGATHERNTIHTCINGKVSSHAYGDWTNIPIIILDPVNKHLSQIVSSNPVDMFTYGSLKLSNDAIILIDQNFFTTIYEQNSDFINKNRNHIILYDNKNNSKDHDSGKIVVDNILSILGYKPQNVGMHCLNNKENNVKITNSLKQIGIDNHLHRSSKYGRLEMIRDRRNSVINALRGETIDYSNDIEISLEELFNLYVYWKNNGVISSSDNEKYNFGLPDNDNLYLKFDESNTKHYLSILSSTEYIDDKYDNIDEFLNNNNIADMINSYGIQVNGNYITLSGLKNHLKDKEVSPIKTEIVKLLLKKYYLLKKYNTKKEDFSK